MSGRAFTGIVGIVAAIVGVILLLTPVHVSVGGNSLGCGTALHEDYSAAVQSSTDLTSGLVALGAAQNGTLSFDDQLNAGIEAGHNATMADQIASGCDSNIGTRRIWAWLLVGLGAVAALGAVVVRRQSVPPATAE